MRHSPNKLTATKSLAAQAATCIGTLNLVALSKRISETPSTTLHEPHELVLLQVAF